MRQLGSHEKTEITLGPSVSIRVYADSRPHVLQTAGLQKGAILASNGRELLEEGLGMGVPVCRYSHGTIFSLNADTFVNDSQGTPSVTKVFNMNGVASKRFRRVKIRRDGFAARLLSIFERAYRNIRRLQPGATMMLNILSMIGMRNEYLECSSRGQIAVTYERDDGGLLVTADFREVATEGLRNIVLTNEQGGSMFTEYSDSSGVRLTGSQIEPWRAISAEWASLRVPETGVQFKVHRPAGWGIVRGREAIKNRMSWSGLDLTSDWVPKTVKYRVEIHGDDGAD